MRAYVFTDSALSSRAGQFAWLAVDVERSSNAAVRKRYPAVALPTYIVIDPATETVTRRWVGGMTVAQLEHFLDESAAAVRAAHVVAASPADSAGAGAAYARAGKAYAAGDYEAAADAFDQGWAAAPAEGAEYARAVEAFLFALSMAERNARGVALAEEALPRLGRTTSAASAAVSGLGFALALPDSAPGRAAAIARFEDATRGLLADSTITLSADDRSSMLATLMEARQDARDEAGAHRAALAWAAFLDSAAAGARTPEERAVFDSHRLSAYLELGWADRAVVFLKASEAALPDDYNPPARLAVAYNALKDWDDALAATDRALARAYGPRKVRIYMARADAFAGKGDVAAARRTLDEAIAFVEALPEAQRSQSTLALLEKRRHALR